MRPDDEGIAKSVRPFKQEQEERSYETRNRANNKRQNSKDQDAAMVAISVARMVLPGGNLHSELGTSENSEIATKILRSTILAGHVAVPWPKVFIVSPFRFAVSRGSYTRRSSTATKANTPMHMRRTATAITGVCIASLFSPAIGVNVPPQR